MKSISYISFVLFFCVISCNNNTDYKQQQKITFSKINQESFILASSIKNIKLIPLENKKQAFVGANPNLKIINNKLYIYESGRGVLNIFSHDGKFIKQFSKKGQGPDEYFGGEDFLIDEQRGTIEILSLQNEKIYVYNNNGRLQKTIETHIPAYSFAKDNEGNYWLSKGSFNLNNDTSANYKLYLISPNGDIINKFLPDSCASNMPITEINFSTYDDKLLYRIYFDANVYKIANGNVSILYAFDFGQYAFPKKVLHTSKINIYKTLISGEYLFITRALENDDYIYIGLSKEGSAHAQYHLIYNKTDNRFTLLKRDMKDEMDIGIGSAYCITEKNELVFIVDPISLKEFLNIKGEKDMLLKYNHLLNENQNSFVMKVQLSE